MNRLLFFFKTKFTFALLGVILAAGAIGSVYIVKSADRQIRTELLVEARLVTQTLNVESVKALSGTPADLGSPDYQRIKQVLTSARTVDPKYRFLYLLGRKSDGTIFIFVDSEPLNSPDYSPPGQIYSEASDETRRVFDTQAAAVEGPVSDRWGTWVSARVPLTDPLTGEFIAVVGIDIAAGNWNRYVAAQAALPVGLLLALLLLGFTYVLLLRTNKLIHNQQEKLQESEKQFRNMFLEHSAVMLLIEPASGRILDANGAASQFYGYSGEQLKCMSIDEINTLDPDQLAAVRVRIHHKEKNYFHFQHKLASGEIRDVETYSTPIDFGGETVLFSIIHDITERRRAEEALNAAKNLLDKTFASLDEAVLVVDSNTRTVITCNGTVGRIFGYAEEDVIGRTTEFLHVDRSSFDRFGQELFPALDAAGMFHTEFQMRRKDGSVFPTENTVTELKDNLGRRTSVVSVVRDITERKRAEDALRMSESEMRAITDSALDAILMMDPKGRVSYWNPAAERILGYTSAEAIGQNLHDLIVPQRYHGAHNTAFPAFQKTGQGAGIGKSHEMEARRKDGTEIPVQFSLASLKINEEWYAVGIISDITERKRAEEALNVEQYLMYALMKYVPYKIYFKDCESRFIRINDTHAQLLGLSDPGQVVGKTDFDFFSDEHAQQAYADEQVIIRTGQPISKEEKETWDDRPDTWVLTTKLPLRDKDDKIIGTFGISLDITERKQAEMALRESNAYLENLINYANAPIIVWDPQFRITRFNHAFEFLIGRSEAEVIGQSLEILFPPALAAHSMALIRKTLTGERWETVEIEILHRDESTRTLLWNSATLFAPDDQTPIATIAQGQDITERKRAEKELQETNRQLEESITRANTLAELADMANVAKSEFLANMSHEIRTPMNGVIGMTGLLLDTDLDEEQQRYAEIVRSSGEALLTLINDILDFSKIEAGKLELETLDFDLLSLLDDCAANLAIYAHEKGLEFLCAADPHVPALLQGDPGRLRQILANLVSNAIKFTHQGEVAVRVFCLSESNGEVELRFSIRDTGIGIPPDKLDLLFNKFTQVDASTTRQFGGTGLGLAISKQLAELMGGKIGVHSEAGRGSEFWFTVRLRLQPEGSSSAIPALANLRGVRILVVDDNATSREILNLRLASWGMRPAEANDGAAALQALAAAQEQGDPFQIAVLDMHMPVMDGATLGQAIKSDENLAETRLVLLSSLGKRGDARRFEQIGFAAYLVKPLRHADLFNVLCTTLAGNASPAEKHAIVTRHSAREIRRVSVGAGTRILLVEDNITNQQVALGILKKFGLRADAAANGIEALKALESIHYDLVLMDVQMPVMDGLEATRRIRDIQSAVLNHDLPIIAMTARALQGDRERCLEAGMNDYVSKPVEPQSLAETLERWLSGKARENPSSAQAKAAPLAAQAGEEQTPSRAGTGTTSSRAGTGTTSVFDKAALMQRLLGDEELARTVIAGFLEDIPLHIQALKDTLEAGDVTGAERQAHTINGASANISGEALRSIAHEMEKSGRNGDLPAIRKRMGELELQFERLREVLKKEI